ncbi:MAG TPA: heme o synthase [Gammaproteobacteria bacterium]|nr:heme o synthase [Gammaproteobacteria bacterium]HET7587670.1 heme o synthase [Gammaproteobacteria bacterium]
MATATITATWHDYYELCKPRVCALIVFTAVVGMLLAAPAMVPPAALIFGTIGIALASASAAAINHLIDRRIDAKMNRTRRRPLPTGHLNERQAAIFAALLGVISMVILTLLVNPLTAVLTLCSLIGYAGIYTMYLKRATPQNIVIGGAAGAAPPILGWTAVTGHVTADALILFLIIFTWTPPHFWALAIARRDDYARVNMPMLPVTHGPRFTTLHILFYTILLTIVSLLPVLTEMSGLLYFVGTLLLDGGFLYYAIALRRSPEDPRLAMKTFGYSITYLMALFALLLVDHYVQPWVGII